jgi:ADP-heptose:LPS heptosyltransferase
MAHRPPLVALRALGLGDLLVAVPALRALRRAFPEHRRLLATPGWLHPLVDLIGGWNEPVDMTDLHSAWPGSVVSAMAASGPAGSAGTSPMPAQPRGARTGPGGDPGGVPPATQGGVHVAARSAPHLGVHPDCGVPPARHATARESGSVAVNLHGNGPESAALLERLAPARRIGHRRPGWPGPEWIEDLPERRRWCRLLAAHGIPADETDLRLPPPPAAWAAVPAERGVVLVHPGGAFGAKRWPEARFATVAARLTVDNRQVLITGSAAERERARRVARLAGLPQTAVYAGRTDIRALAALVSGAGLVISGDTGIAHLAATFATPSVTLFGPADPRRWGPPPGGPHRVLHGPGRRGEPFADDPDPALLAITVAEVLAAAAGLLG